MRSSVSTKADTSPQPVFRIRISAHRRVSSDADGRLRYRTVSAAGTQAVSDTLVYDAGGKVSTVHSRTAPVIRARYHGAGGLAFWHSGALGAAEHRTIEMDALGNPRREEGFNGGNADQEGKSTFYREYGYVMDGTGRLRYTVSAPSASITSVLFEQTDDFDDSGNRYRSEVVERAGPSHTVREWTRLYYGADEKLRVVDRQRCLAYADQSTNVVQACVAWDQSNGKDPSAFEEYRYDALGRRVLVRRRLDPACQVECTSTIERFVWDGDDILAEIRAPGQDGTSAATLESDNPSGAQYGRVLYTHGMGIDAPLSLVRTGHAIGTFTVIPLANWRGIFDQGRFPDGTTQKCTTGGVCLNLSDLRWAARGAFFESLLGYHEKTWAGSLLESKQDASGQLYMRNRYFDPKMGRFTQEDPISFAGGMNLYGFGGGDAVNYSDPYGLSAQSDTTKTGQTPDTRHGRCEVAGILNNYISALSSNPGRFASDDYPGEFDFKYTEGGADARYQVGNQWLRADEFGNFAAGYAGQHAFNGLGHGAMVAGGIYFAMERKANGERTSGEHWSDRESRPMINAGAARAILEQSNNGGMSYTRDYGARRRPYIEPLTSRRGCN